MPARLAAAPPTRLSSQGPDPVRILPLSMLRPGQWAEVVGLAAGEGEDALWLRLLEIGFIEGERVRVTALGPGGREPIAVRVGDSQFALRRFEADQVLVRTTEAP
ncbi:MAG: hypothetical protein KatS3mg126_1758 [Lysobacteraceae bacterium]|nr:MAG: hypothetical protein KatS3mg126_1758 [Xanthomonadaceae bacterium]